MAISTRMSRNPVTPSAQSPWIGARPSSSRPSSVKNSMAASMSSTTMPTLSIRLTVMTSPWRLTSNYAAGCGITPRRKELCRDNQYTRSPAPLLLTQVFSPPQRGPTGYAPQAHEPSNGGFLSLLHPTFYPLPRQAPSPRHGSRGDPRLPVSSCHGEERSCLDSERRSLGIALSLP